MTPVRMYLDVSLMDVHPADQTPGSVLAARTYHVNFAGGAGSGTIPAELQVPEGRGSHLLDYRPAAEPMSPVSTSMGLLDVHASSPTKSPGSWLKRAKENEIPI